ncbi:hypothetical protein HDV00_006165 [Rhizophlyctis rosea]|nr:hypothetical protein HDV00_006165 [Rhizophlyctis rosea]
MADTNTEVSPPYTTCDLVEKRLGNCIFNCHRLIDIEEEVVLVTFSCNDEEVHQTPAFPVASAGMYLRDAACGGCRKPSPHIRKTSQLATLSLQIHQHHDDIGAIGILAMTAEIRCYRTQSRVKNVEREIAVLRADIGGLRGEVAKLEKEIGRRERWGRVGTVFGWRRGKS